MKRLCRIRTKRVGVGEPIDAEPRDTGYKRKVVGAAGTTKEGQGAKEEKGETREALAGMGAQRTDSMS